jgi:tetratricopeptide (TPR) repeat protein
MKSKFLLFLFLLLCLAISFGYYKKPNTVAYIYRNLGSESFLTFHKNNLAIWFLEKSKNKNNQDYYTSFLLGRVYFVEGKLSKSILNYTESIKLNKEYKEAYYGRGLTYGFSSPIFYPEAIKDFQTYIDMDNAEYQLTGGRAYGAWAGYNDLAWVYYLSGNFAKAEEAARAGLEITQSNPWLLNMLGAILLEQHRCGEAIESLKQADLLLGAINKDQFGEAYSGDNPKNWEPGKENMAKTIKDNLELCKSFPQ